MSNEDVVQTGIVGRRRAGRGLLLALLCAIAVAAFGARAAQAAVGANLDQCSNGTTPGATTCNWVNGDLNQNNSLYREGDSVPFRVDITGLGSGTHTLVIEYDTIQSGKHAYDYETTFNRTVTGANPLDGISGLSGTDTEAVPTTCIENKPSTMTQVPGNFTIYGGSFTAAATCAPTSNGISEQVTLTFTSGGSEVVVAWGGHVGSQIDWGAGNAAGSINGSPYHQRVLSIDGTGGNQDRSMKAGAVAPLPPTFATNASSGTLAIGASATDTATLAGTQQNGVVTGSVEFFLCGPSLTAYPDCTQSAGDASRHSLGSGTIINGTAVSPSTGALTAAGKYCIDAIYTPDSSANYSPAEETNQTQQSNNNGGECFSVQPAAPTLTTTASGPVVVGAAIHDTAHLTGGASPTGTISFQVFGPGDTTCSNPLTPAPGSATASGAGDYTSGDFTTTALGDYRWIAHYAGDANNNPVDTKCNDANETSTVGKATPTLTTTASGPVTVGSGIHDTAHLTGGFSPSGSISFEVFGPGDTTCAHPLTPAVASATASGAGDYASGDFVANAAGDYRWIAHYAGDANNNPVDTKCNDANETSTVGKATPTLTTTASGPATVGSAIHDTAHLSGGSSPTGSITFEVFGPGDTSCSTALTPAVSGATAAGAGDYASGDFTTAAAGDYRWIAHYAGDANNNPVDTKCNDANETSTVGKATPTLTTTASGPVVVGSGIHDTAHLSGGSSPSGSITFEVFGPGDTTCSTALTPAVSGATASGAGDYASGDFVANAAGDYRWIAHYAGDANNNPVDTKCNDANETSTVGKATPALTTTASGGVPVGGSIHDTAHLAGGVSPSGSITFEVFGPGDTTCSTALTPAVSGATASGAGDYASGDFVANAAGDYRWIAHYAGDANNNPVDTKCNDANETSTVGKATPTLTTTLSATEVVAGTGVHDTSTLTGATADAGGTVTYSVYSNDQCSQGKRDAGTKTVSNGVVPDSNSLSFPAAGTFYWQAEYSGDSNNAGATSACTEEQLVVDHPAISITKNPKTQLIEKGADANFTIAVTNSGTVTLTDVAVTDAQAPGCAKTIGTLTPGQSTSYDCALANVTAPFTNSATATGHPPVGPDVTATDTADVSVKATPTITTTLSAFEILAGSSVHDSATLAGATGDAGGTVSYVVYADSTCRTQFAAAGTVTVDAGLVPNSNGVAFPTAGSYYWQAVYSGDAKNDGATSACTEEQLAVDSPAISITKNPKSQSITAGGTANFTITVKNTGTVQLTNVSVVDLLATGCAKTIGTLAPGQSTQYDCALSGVGASFTNSATATGHPPVGPDVTATDTAPVTVNAVPPPPPPPPPAPPAPKIDLAIAKVGTPNPTTLGGNITWTLTVTNNGPDAATGVTVADPIPAGTTFVSATPTQGTCTGGAVLDCKIGAMKAGTSVTVTLVTGTTFTGNVPNTATVVGNEAETNTSNNTASASVLVKGVFKPPAVNYCTALRVSPKQLLVGRSHVLTMKLTRHGKAARGVKVRIKGSSLRILTKPSNRKGIVKRTVKPTKPGIVTFRAVGGKRCGAPRIGVIGVFTPPVTG